MEQKKPMEGAYFAIFSLSILLAIVTLFTQAAFGTVFWCFVAYQMHKRNNQLLSSVFKFMAWFEIAVGTIALFYFAGDIPNSGGWFFAMLALIGGIAAVMFALHNYFKNLAQRTDVSDRNATNISAPTPIPSTVRMDTVLPTIDTQPSAQKNEDLSDLEAWETAYKEAEGEGRVIAIWAKCFADTNGEEQKCKAQYIRLRAEELLTQRTQRLKALEDERLEREIAELKATERAKAEEVLLERENFHQGLANEAKDTPATFKALIFVPLILFAVFGLTFWLVGKAEDPNPSKERFEVATSSGDVMAETREIAEQNKYGAYPRYFATITNPESSYESRTKAINSNLIELSQSDVNSLELANRWWTSASGDEINIYTKNRTKFAIKRILFDVSDVDCNREGKHYLLAFELNNEIPPNSVAVISGKPPFKFFRYIPNGKNCGLIVKAYGKK